MLATDCSVAEAFDPKDPSVKPKWAPFKAIWDTGATGCVITQRVVDACGLKPIGMVQVAGVHGIENAEQFLVGILLPNSLQFATVPVTFGRLAGDVDVLVGMNIITTGDFSITNLNGSTVFSFRYPSLHEIDYVEDHNRRVTPYNIPQAANRAQRRAKKR
jgi:hypothetical protein